MFPALVKPYMVTSNGGTALVTGGHGFLGSHLVDLLLAKGVRVRGLVRPGRTANPYAGRPVEVVLGDLAADGGLDEAARGADLVFHVAGLIAARGPGEFRRINVEGTRRLAAAVARSSPSCRRFVYVSSLAAAGPSRDGRPIDEEADPRPISHYGRSKLGGEDVLAEALRGVPWTVLRPPAIYGPRDEGILPFFQMAAAGIAPGLEGRGRRFNLLHARDVAEGIWRAALSDRSVRRTYFLADPSGYGYGDVARALAGAFGVRGRRIPVPDFILDLAAVLTDEVAGLMGRVPIFGRQKALELKTRYWLASAERARAELGWEPRIPLERGMEETARWYEAQGKVRPRRRFATAGGTSL